MESLHFGEDRLFNYDFLSFCGRILTVNKVFYNYQHINPDSLTTAFRPHHIDELLKLHKQKMDCMLRLSRKTDAEEKATFQKYDICKTVSDAFSHLIEHRSVLSEREMEDELAYLETVRLPDCFYIGSNYTGENLIDYINRNVFPEENETIERDSFHTVVLMGSRACKYRVEYAFERFGDVRYICCGGNTTCYKTPDGADMIEADYMSEYLRRHKVQNVTIDSTSTNTLENITNASRLIQREERVAVVTGAFHQKRVRHALNAIGLDWEVVGVYGPNTTRENWYRNAIGLDVVLQEYNKLRMTTENDNG